MGALEAVNIQGRKIQWVLSAHSTFTLTKREGFAISHGSNMLGVLNIAMPI